MSDSNSSISGGVGVLGLLGVILVTLKLCEVINWSWWWVTAPFWGGFALMLVLAFGGLLLAGVVMVIAAIFGKKSRYHRIRKRSR